MSAVTLDGGGASYTAGAVALLALVAVAYHASGRSARIANAAASSATLVGGTALLAVLSYAVAAVSASRPLADAALARADVALGFDWAAFHAWAFASRPRALALVAIYFAFFPELIGVVIATGFARRGGRVVAALLLAALVTVIGSAFVPAIGHLPHASHVPVLLELRALRAGVPYALDLRRAEGLIAFPSYHAAVAVVLTWALWPWRAAFVVGALLNAAMVVATLPVGGHYLVDVVAGVVVALASIALVEVVTRRISASVSRDIPT